MSSDIWTTSSIYELTEEDLSNFRDIVLRDVKNQSPSEEDKSILSNNIDLWLYTLRTIRREIELQLANHKSNLKIKIKDLKDNNTPQNDIDEVLYSEERWRNNAMKFLTAVERKTLYVKLLISEDDK
jgi:hypothetical protein